MEWYGSNHCGAAVSDAADTGDSDCELHKLPHLTITVLMLYMETSQNLKLDKLEAAPRKAKLLVQRGRACMRACARVL